MVRELESLTITKLHPHPTPIGPDCLKPMGSAPIMPPKFDPGAPENASLINLFTSLGLAQNSATELVRQPKSGAALKSLIDEYHLDGKTRDEKQAAALVKLSTARTKLGGRQKGYIVEKIGKGDLRTPDQVAGKMVSG